MKDVTYYDGWHDNVIIVKNPKSRKDAAKRVLAKYVKKWFDFSTIEDAQGVDIEDDNVLCNLGITERNSVTLK